MNKIKELSGFDLDSDVAAVILGVASLLTSILSHAFLKGPAGIDSICQIGIGGAIGVLGAKRLKTPNS